MDVDECIAELRNELELLEKAILSLERQVPKSVSTPDDGACRPRLACRTRARHRGKTMGLVPVSRGAS